MEENVLKYLHEHKKSYVLRLDDSIEGDKELITYLDQKDDVVNYLKNLIREEMNRQDCDSDFCKKTV